MEDSLHTEQLAGIMQRLESLEGENRRWKALATVALLTLGGVFLIGAGKHAETSVPQELQARAFVLVDQEGVPLARLGVLPHGALGLGLYDQGKKGRLILSIDSEGASSLSLLGKDGKGGVLLTAAKNGATSLRLLDTRWKTRGMLATWPDGSPFVQLTDRDGKDRLLLQYTEVTTKATGELMKRPGPSLLLFDQDDNVLWQAP